jgi:hypothetical protein
MTKREIMIDLDAIPDEVYAVIMAEGLKAMGEKDKAKIMKEVIWAILDRKIR